VHPSLKQSPIARNVQLAELFRHRIARGDWPLGYKLPTRDDLMVEFGVSRVTIRQALDRLAREGLISAERGSGTVVTGGVPTERWFHLETTLEDLHKTYLEIKPQIRNVAEGSGTPRLTDSDGKPALRYHFIRRIHARGRVPYCVISIYLDERVFKKAAKRFREEIVISVLREVRGVKVAKARQTLTIGAADLEAAALLDVPANTPIAEVRRVFTDPAGVVIYLAEVTYKGETIRLEMDLRV
jgi:GntR family transcriptional regulator